MNDKTKKILIVAGLFAAVVIAVVLKNLRYEADARVVKIAAPADSNTAGMPLMLELGSHSCVPCKAMMPILAELKKEYGDMMRVEFIDLWKDETAGAKYKVEMIPTQIFFDKDGKEVFRHTGFFAKDEIIKKWKELGLELKGKN